MPLDNHWDELKEGLAIRKYPQMAEFYGYKTETGKNEKDDDAEKKVKPKDACGK